MYVTWLSLADWALINLTLIEAQDLVVETYHMCFMIKLDDLIKFAEIKLSE